MYFLYITGAYLYLLYVQYRYDPQKTVCKLTFEPDFYIKRNLVFLSCIAKCRSCKAMDPDSNIDRQPFEKKVLVPVYIVLQIIKFSFRFDKKNTRLY
jgi:hypothetical protein